MKLQVLCNVVKQFFPAPFASVQRLSALFPHRKFFSIANVVFKYLVSIPKMNLYRDPERFRGPCCFLFFPTYVFLCLCCSANFAKHVSPLC